MKIRTDFVTNSSSSSFVLVTKLSSESLVEAIEADKLFEFAQSSPWLYDFCKHNGINHNYISRDDIRSWTVFKNSRGDYEFDTIMDNFPLDNLIDCLGGYVIGTN